MGKGIGMGARIWRGMEGWERDAADGRMGDSTTSERDYNSDNQPQANGMRRMV